MSIDTNKIPATASVVLRFTGQAVGQTDTTLRIELRYAICATNDKTKQVNKTSWACVLCSPPPVYNMTMFYFTNLRQACYRVVSTSSRDNENLISVCKAVVDSEFSWWGTVTAR